MREFIIRNFDKGTIDKIEDFSIDENAASRSLNWLTLGDKLELTGGYTILGTEDESAGRITGLAAPSKVDGTQILLKTYGQKLEYLDTDWTESGTDLLGADADGEDVAITGYTSLAGYQAWISSPNSGLFKMMLANPDDVKDLSDASGVYQGYINAENSALWLWYRANNKNYLYRSYKDLQNTTVYTTVSAEAIGAAPGPSYSGTLAAVTGDRTCFNVVMTDGTKTIQDDKDGNFTGDGTGTINYATGAYSVTFDGATVAPVTADYEWEDSGSNGLADFSFTTPTRSAAEGFFLPQPTGGDLQSVLFYESTAYCLHEKNAWIFNLSADDTTVNSHEVFREAIGMDNWRAAVATGEGIYYIDTANPSEPRFKLLTLQQQSDRVVPVEFSFNVNLSGFDFSDGVGFQWGDYIAFACKSSSDAAANDRMWLYHKEWKSFDLTNYFVSCMEEYQSNLVCGDSSQNNVYQALTGFSANGSVVQNYWEGKLSKLEVEEIKKFKRLTLRGSIGADQEIEVFLAYDRGPFTSVGTIRGDGGYVNKTSEATVGSPQVGSTEAGGGGSGITAYDYVREIKVNSDRFDEVKIKFVANSVGYASVTEINYYDVRKYTQKNLQRYRTT